MCLCLECKMVKSASETKKVRTALKGYGGSIVCLLETLVKKIKMSTITSSILPGWNCIDNYDYAILGRIWVLYNDTVNTSVYCSSSQTIHSHVNSRWQRNIFSGQWCMLQMKIWKEKNLSELGNLETHMCTVPMIAMLDFSMWFVICKKDQPTSWGWRLLGMSKSFKTKLKMWA